VQGKYVDAEGNVYSQSEATTPNNKLYCVIYSTAPIPDAMPYIDGVQFYQVVNQTCCLGILDSNITALRANFPGKEIQIGIYLKNSGTGWLGPTGVRYTLAHALDRYDDGDINGVTLFAGVFLITENIPLSIYNGFNLPHWLDSLYYPYLGAGHGKLYDCTTGSVLTDAFVRVYCKGRVSGDTLFRSRQKTDANGQYHFGLWAGNRNTDSTYYWFIAEKEGYLTDTVGFWIKRGDTTVVPSLSLCPIPDSTAGQQQNVKLYPNPTTGNFMLLTAQGEQTDGMVEVYNMLGQKVYSAPRQYQYVPVNLSEQQNGVYLVVVRSGNRTFNSKQLLVLQH
jgi:type IX secretion system substrate protein